MPFLLPVQTTAKHCKWNHASNQSTMVSHCTWSSCLRDVSWTSESVRVSVCKTPTTTEQSSAVLQTCMSRRYGVAIRIQCLNAWKKQSRQFKLTKKWLKGWFSTLQISRYVFNLHFIRSSFGEFSSRSASRNTIANKSIYYGPMNSLSANLLQCSVFMTAIIHQTCSLYQLDKHRDWHVYLLLTACHAHGPVVFLSLPWTWTFRCSRPFQFQL